jgi:glycosyltransferase involved in cell wall biosynthesis
LKLILSFAIYRRRADIQAIYVHQPTSLIIGIAIGFFLNIPVVYHCHGLSGSADISRLGILFNFALKRANKVIAISDFVKKQLVKVVPESSIRLVYNWIPSYDMVSQRKLREVDFLFIGRLCKDKGLHSFIDVLESKADYFCAYIVGPKEDINYADSHLSKIQADGRFEYLNILSHKDIMAVLENTKYLIVPSQWGEPFGLVVVEAMQRGAVVLARTDGAIPEIITHGVNGFLFENDEGLKDLIDNIHYCDLSSIRNNAIKTVLSRFNPDVQIKKVLSTLSESFECVR